MSADLRPDLSPCADHKVKSSGQRPLEGNSHGWFTLEGQSCEDCSEEKSKAGKSCEDPCKDCSSQLKSYEVSPLEGQSCDEYPFKEGSLTKLLPLLPDEDNEKMKLILQYQTLCTASQKLSQDSKKKKKVLKLLRRKINQLPFNFSPLNQC